MARREFVFVLLPCCSCKAFSREVLERIDRGLPCCCKAFSRDVLIASLSSSSSLAASPLILLKGGCSGGGCSTFRDEEEGCFMMISIPHSWGREASILCGCFSRTGVRVAVMATAASPISYIPSLGLASLYERLARSDTTKGHFLSFLDLLIATR
jgi:hypothetical protein